MASTTAKILHAVPSSTAAADTKQVPNQNSPWRSKFLQAGCDEKMIDALFAAKVVTRYDHVYLGMTRLPAEIRKNLNVSHLCCLSGEMSALTHAHRLYDLTTNADAFDFTALSGSLEGIKFFTETLKIKPSPLTLFYAAHSGMKNAVTYCVNDLKLDTNTKFEENSSLLHIMGLSGSVELVKYGIDDLRLDFKAVDHYQETILHYALASGSLDLVTYCIETLGCDPIVRTTQGRTVLHSAAIGGSADTIFYIRGILAEYGSSITSDDMDNDRVTAIQFAKEYVSDPEKTREAIIALIQPLTPQAANVNSQASISASRAANPNAPASVASAIGNADREGKASTCCNIL